MAKNDYDYIVFRILLYLYACLKRQSSYDKRVLMQKIATDAVPEEYFLDVLRMMQQEGLVSGVTFVRAWGREYILADGLDSLSITAEGIHYLKDNGRMQVIREAVLKEAPGAIMELVKLALMA